MQNRQRKAPPPKFQYLVLNAMRTSGDPVIALTMSEAIYRGKVKAFDEYTIIIETELHGDVLIWKHALESIRYDKEVSR